MRRKRKTKCPLLKSESINYQQKLAHELKRESKGVHIFTPASAFISLSVLVEEQRLPSEAVCKKGILYHRTEGVVLTLHHLHFPD